VGALALNVVVLAVAGRESSLFSAIMIVGVAISLYGHLMLWHCLASEPGLREAARVRARRSLLQFGPAAVVQLLIGIYFPGSGLAGGQR
jgi:hypothetical protein